MFNLKLKIISPSVFLSYLTQNKIFRVSGPYASVMTYTAEFHCTKDRPKITMLVGFMITAGSIVGAGMKKQIDFINYCKKKYYCLFDKLIV